MDLDASIKRFIGVDHGNWARYAHPWTGLTRVITLPLFFVAWQSISWIGIWAAIPIATVFVWVVLHTRVFPPLKDYNNWVSRGLLGEQWYLARKRGDIPFDLLRNLYVSLGVLMVSLVPLSFGLGELAPGWIALGTILIVAGQLMLLKCCDLIFQHMTGHIPGTPLTDPKLPPSGDKK
ncbi:MAG: DUF6653 family protein [Pseudomonadota bacterium]